LGVGRAGKLENQVGKVEKLIRLKGWKVLKVGFEVKLKKWSRGV
jgi:hypothetical protein